MFGSGSRNKLVSSWKMKAEAEKNAEERRTEMDDREKKGTAGRSSS